MSLTASVHIFEWTNEHLFNNNDTNKLCTIHALWCTLTCCHALL